MKYVRFDKCVFGLWVLAGILVGLTLAGCSPKEPIRIGFVAGTSGRVADLGISGRDAIQMLVEQCNQTGASTAAASNFPSRTTGRIPIPPEAPWAG